MCSCVLTATAAVAAPLRVIYPRQAENDSRDTYKIELLERVLQATTNEFGGFVLEPSAAVMTENRMDALMGCYTIARPTPELVEMLQC